MISPRVFALNWAILLPLIAWVGWGRTGFWAGLGLFAAGLLIWTLFEYAMHRYLFHLKVEWPAVKWFVFLIHGNHHDNPNDPMRDMMPLSVSLPVAALVWGACLMLLGGPGTWLFLGFILGYVVYDTVHYASHQWPMRGKLASALKRHHMRHHYVDEHGNYAISAIFWDRLFGSMVRSLKRP
ncbi:sterol desaturase family protein [Sphingobium sp. Sx8-8]|uniref:sterol desaturase family protein n=1 Tax=Sphingobium sp. Sx8-8 TaxID=2933617 RepID=UPI001F56C323|nr:sterol desaturase family protein [Sphingobium sp. Sx8-8]